jgi:protein gp37
MENTSIEWCDHTFNPWIGCTRVSPGCDHCYAATRAVRFHMQDTAGNPLWNPGADRHRTSSVNWKAPLKWNRDAARAGVRARVFCASLADVWDNQVPDAWRADLLELIRATPALDWLLLTKRPQNIAKMLPAKHFRNIWLGTTAETMEEAARRIPVLLRVPAVIRFLSCEPLLEPLDLTRYLRGSGVHWIICGGESGPRPMDPKWARSLRDQCRATGTAFFMKQMAHRGTRKMPIPADLMVRQFPL